MPRLLINGEWYEQLASEGQYEADFERLLQSYAEHLFAGFITVPFKRTVQSDHGSAKPDLALVDQQYRGWWIVEVEMAHHSLEGHVLPQVDVLTKARYGSDEAEYLIASSRQLDATAVRAMVKGEQPRVMVIVNRNVQGWAERLYRMGAILTVAELYRSDKNHYVILANGEAPGILATDVVTTCRQDPLMSWLVKISSPAGLIPSGDGVVSIEFEGGFTEWTLIEVQDQVWLSPSGRSPLQIGVTYQIVKRENSRLVFEKLD